MLTAERQHLLPRDVSLLRQTVHAARTTAERAWAEYSFEKDSQKKQSASRAYSEAYRTYHRVLENFLAYISETLTIETKDGKNREALIRIRGEAIGEMASFEKTHKSILSAYGVKLRERFLSLSPRMQKVAMYTLITAAVGTGLAIRAAKFGSLGVVSFAASFLTGRYIRRRLKDGAENGTKNRFVRWVTNADQVNMRDKELEIAYTTYTESDREGSSTRIAEALAKKRRALLWQKMGITLWGAGGGISAGGMTILSSLIPEVNQVFESVDKNIVPGAQAAVLHSTDGTTKEMISTASQEMFYDRLLRYDGWFAVSNGDGTYNIYHYEPGHQGPDGLYVKGHVRFATGPVKNLAEINEGPIPELKNSDLLLLTDEDQITITRFQRPWYLDPFRSNNTDLLMSEAEMRSADLYKMTPLPWRVVFTADFWGRAITSREEYLTAGNELQEVIYNTIFGPVKFLTAFVVGDKGLSDKNIVDLFGVLFNKHVTGADLPDSPGKNTIMTTEIDEHREWALWYWLIGHEAPPPDIVGTEDLLVADMPLWRRAAFLAHELGHAIHAMTHMDEVFSALSVEDREEIMRELYALRDYITELQAKGKSTNYKGWTDDMKQLTVQTATVKDNEMFADAFAKLLTHPDILKAKCPRLYLFLRDLIDTNKPLRGVIGVR